MKKITTFLVAFFLVFALSACNSNYEKPLTPEELIEKINNKESFMLVASSTTCSDCKDFKVEIREFRDDNNDVDVYFFEINRVRLYQDRMNFLNAFNLNALPTSYFFHEGELLKAEEGIIKTDDLAEMYQKYVVGK